MASLVYNKKVKFNYEILETYSAGIELLGFEVKSLRKGGSSLEGARVLVRGGEVYVVGLRIVPFQVGNTDKDYDPMRTRRLLMTKKEILELGKQSEGKGLTLVPIELYTKGVHIKVAVGLVRGKKLHDKRETIKKRDIDRELRRSLK